MGDEYRYESAGGVEGERIYVIEFIRSIKSIKFVRSVAPCGALCSWQLLLPFNTVRSTPVTL